MQPGDTFTIEGIHRKVKNGKRKWWQFWKPRYIQGPLRVFKLHSVSPPLSVGVWTIDEFEKYLK
jgi:hypothetical protein